MKNDATDMSVQSFYGNGDGTDFTFTAAVTTTQDTVLRKNNITIPSTSTVTSNNQVLVLMADTQITISGIIDMSAKGPAVGTDGLGNFGHTGAATLPAPGIAIGWHSAAAYLGATDFSRMVGAPGGNGGPGTAATAFTGGTGGAGRRNGGTATLGTGSTGTAGTPGSGGKGGGVIILVAKRVLIDSTATVRTDGANGTAGTSNSGGGGGGSGGTIIIVASEIKVVSGSTISLQGGIGGAGGGTGWSGGTGGAAGQDGGAAPGGGGTGGTGGGGGAGGQLVKRELQIG